MSGLIIIVKIVYVLIHVLIAAYDFSFYRIPNLLLAALLVLYGLFAPFSLSSDALLNSLIVFGVVLSIGFALFVLKIIGGGDAKYIAVASLWVGFPGVIQLLFFITTAGALLALVYLFLKYYMAKSSDWGWKQIQNAERRLPILQYVWLGSGVGPEDGVRENIDARMIPYGVAIAIGAIIVMFLHSTT
ncbi:MAG: prepilin peptidase [Alphaproteobacteria bacterium]|nr:prepilin peptidase [Alphaproteobacteria bacterium]